MLTVGLKTIDTHAMVDVEALLDSGATGLFINHVLVHGNGIHMHKLEQSVIVYNINRMVNKGGSITEEVTLIMSYQNLLSEFASSFVVVDTHLPNPKNHHMHIWTIHSTGYCTGHWLLKFEIPDCPTWVGQEDLETVEIMNFGYV
jgi:hypothetical protein